jgi:hypothetical protein
MPVYETTPGQKSLVFVHPKNGKFSFDKSEDGQVREVAAIEGTLELVKIEDDPGNKQYKISPYEAFIMHVSDDEATYRIKINLDRNFAFSVGAVLADLQKGDRVMLKARAGDDPTVTFCNILKDVAGSWVRPEREDLPKEKPEKLARIKAIVEAHSAKPAPKTTE